MALSLKVGSFLITDQVPTQVVTGVGFMPKVLMFWAQDALLEDGAIERVGRILLGFSDGVNERAIAVNSGRSGITSIPVTNTRRAISNSALFALFGGPSGKIWEFGVSSMNADGFTLAYSIQSPDITEVFYIALGGTDVENVKIGSFDGEVGVSRQTVDGLGFRPDYLSVVGGGTAAGVDVSAVLDDAAFTLGMATSLNQYTTGIRARDELVLSQTTTTVKEELIGLFSRSLPGLDTVAAFRTFEDDGFTLGWDRAAEAYRYFYLAIKGPRFKIGHSDTPEEPTKNTVIGTGFLPKGLITMSNGATTTLPYLAPSIAYSFGATDGTFSVVTGYSDPNDVLPNIVEKEKRDNLVLVQGPNGGTKGLASLFEFGVKGFTLNWVVSNPPGLKYFYTAIGPKADTAGVVVTNGDALQLTNVGSSVNVPTVVQTIVWSGIAAKGDRLRLSESATLGSISNLILSASSAEGENTIVFPFNGFAFQKGMRVGVMDSGLLFVYKQPLVLVSQTPLTATLVDTGDLTLVAAVPDFSIFVRSISWSTAGGGNNVLSFREGLAGPIRFRTEIRTFGTGAGREVYDTPWKLPVNTALVGNLASSSPDIYVNIQYFLSPA